MSLGEIFGRSWRIIWKHKVLWLFGILSSCGSGSRFNFNNNFSTNPKPAITPNPNNQLPAQLPPELQDMFTQITSFFQRMTPGGITILIVLACVLTLLVVILGAIGRAGLAKGAWMADGGHPQLSLGLVWDETEPYIWTTLGLQIVMGLVLLLIIAVVGAITFGVASVTKGIGACLLLPLICLMVPFFWLMEIVLYQGTAAVVGDELGVFKSLSQGWRATFDYLPNIIITGLVLMITTTILNILIALPAFAVLLPMFYSFVSGENIRAGITTSLGLFCLYLPFMLVLSGIIQAFHGTAWTLVYRRLINRRANEELPVVQDPQPQWS